jgi:hypothetical protein
VLRTLLLATVMIFVGAPLAWADPDAPGPVASAAGSASTPAEPTADPPAPTPSDAPDPAALAAAPAADQASGVVVRGPRERHRIANTLLAIPRFTADLLLTGPRYAAARLDNYLESRSPNAFGRGEKKSSWRFGATVDWETALGASTGVRVGRSFAEAATVDVHVGLFGARGQSGGLVAKLGSYTEANLEPSLSFDAGRQQRRAFAGFGEPLPPRITYEQDSIEGAAGLSSDLGRIKIIARAIGDIARDEGEDMVVPVAGWDETQRAGTAELSAAYDSRRIAHPFNHNGAWSSGTLVRGTGAYTAGHGSRSGAFAFVRGTLEAKQLFDLFHGDRVLTIGARLEVIDANAMDVPFDRLPALGGMARLRAFARDELRDRVASFADLNYEWPLGGNTRAYLFVETGSAQSTIAPKSPTRLHVGYGGGIRFLTGNSTVVRLQVAGADDGVIGAYFQLGAL